MYFNIELGGAEGAAIVLVAIDLVVFFEEPGMRDEEKPNIYMVQSVG